MQEALCSPIEQHSEKDDCIQSLPVRLAFCHLATPDKYVRLYASYLGMLHEEHIHTVSWVCPWLEEREKHYNHKSVASQQF